MKRPNRKPEDSKPCLSTKTDVRKLQLLEALQKTFGNITASCQMAGCCRDTYYDYYNNDEEFRKKVQELPEMMVDFGEMKLLELVDNMHPDSVKFLLKTKGKHRGYTEKQEVVQTNIDVSNDIDFAAMTDEDLETFSTLCRKYRKKN